VIFMTMALVGCYILARIIANRGQLQPSWESPTANL